jgi:hypothetical protein
LKGQSAPKRAGDIIVQYPGRTTSERAIYSGRFNVTEGKGIANEPVEL